MSTLINEIDARTRLAGANQMELLLFKLGTNEIFGINVFKVREVMKLPELTQIPEADSRIVGMANIRGIMVPVVGLKRSLGLGTENDLPGDVGSGVESVPDRFRIQRQLARFPGGGRRSDHPLLLVGH
jgi:chemotaxis signal transduction protein